MSVVGSDHPLSARRSHRRIPLLLLAGLLLAPGASPGQDDDDDLEHRFAYGRHPAPMQWAWGELFYGRVYRSRLLVTNECEEPRPVRVYVGSGVAPYLSIEKNPEIPARTENHPIPVTITTPDPPEEFVAGPGVDPFGGAIFVDIWTLPYNWVVLEHSANWRCRSDPKIMEVTGHIHVDPNPADDSSGACLVAWNTGVVHPGLDLDSCTSEFREYARHHRDEVLDRWIRDDPAGWAWLPTLEEIASMDAAALLEMKRRADRQRAGQTATAEEAR